MIFPRKFAAFTAALLTCTLLFSSCRLGRVENDFVFDLDAAPVNLDPQSAGDTASKQAIANLFEGLVSVGDDGEPQPAAAESWTVSADECTYIFSLREDGRWEDGSPVTADDFVFGFQRLLDPDTNAPAAEDFYVIQNASAVHSGELEVSALGVRALSEYSLEIRLTEPDPYFFEKLDTAAAMPCHEEYFIGTNGRYGVARDKIMGNGAFYLAGWAENGNLTFRPNQYYHSADEVTATSVLYVAPREDRASTLSRFLDGTISAACLTGSEYLAATENGEFEILENDGAVWGMVFNTSSEPFSSLAFRQALFQSADFSSMEEALPQYLTRTQEILPSGTEIDGVPYRSLAPAVSFPALDPGAAAASLETALAEVDADSLRGARMIIPAGEEHAEYFAYLSQVWQRDLGLYLTVETLDTAEYESRLASGDFECALLCLSGNENRPASMLSALSGGSYGCTDPTYAGLVDRAVSAEGQELAGLCAQAEQLLLDSCTFLPFYLQTEYFVMNAGVTGVTYHFQTDIPDFRFGEIK